MIDLSWTPGWTDCHQIPQTPQWSTASLRSGSEMIMRIRGVKPVRSKGRLYLYHRATGERIYADPSEPAAVAREVERLNAKAKVKASTPGTLLAVQEAYRRSPFWRDLRPATRLSY